MAMQEWFDAMAAKDIDAVMATFHEDFLCVMNEQLYTREDMKQGFYEQHGWRRLANVRIRCKVRRRTYSGL